MRDGTLACMPQIVEISKMNWEQIYRTGDTPWDKGAPAPPLLEWIERHGPLRGNILVPGCGSGRDVRTIASASQAAQVVGMDVAPSALDQARRFPVAGQETYLLADLFDLPAGLMGSSNTPVFAPSIPNNVPITSGPL